MSDKPDARWGCLALFLASALFGSLMVNAGLVAYVRIISPGESIAATDLEEVELEEGDGTAKVVVVNLMGVIAYEVKGEASPSMVEDILVQLRKAGEDDDVKAVLLRVDSPGGEVTASDVIYDAVARLRDEDHKPVVVHVVSVGASGAYYASMGSSYVMANPTAITGSIGVILQTLDYRGLLDKVGVRFRTFKSGKWKDMLSGDREPSVEELAYVQGLVMETYDRFAKIVAEERQIDLEELKGKWADGRVVSADQAVEAGLIDEVGYYEDAVEKARELGGAKGAAVVQYAVPRTLARLLERLGESGGGGLTVQVGPELPEMTRPGKLYYLAPHMFAR